MSNKENKNPAPEGLKEPSGAGLPHSAGLPSSPASSSSPALPHLSEDALQHGGFNLNQTENKDQPQEAEAAPRQETPLILAPYLTWVSLVLVLALSVVLAFTAGNIARDALLEKQRGLAAFLAEDLNNRIYRFFTLPSILSFGRITLEMPAQYDRLDLVVQETIRGQNVHDLRIYDHSGIVNYATDKNLAGLAGLASPEVEKSREGTSPIFVVDKKKSYFESFLAFNQPSGTFFMRTTFPLRMENRLGSSDPEGPAMGVLEFTQDISADMGYVARLQWMIIGSTLVFSLIFVTLLLVFTRRAERALTARMRERQALIRKLHQNERLAAMGRVTSGIAHEIRNPLGIIRSSAELLIKRDAGQDKVSRNILEAIHEESKRLSQTVNDFLDYARPRMPRYAPLNLGQLIDQALLFLDPELNAKGCAVTRRYNAEDESLRLEGDKDLLYRAIYNVLGNAAQAMSEAATKNPEIIIAAVNSVDAQSNEQYLELSISDNGPGFKEEDKSKILDPFFTTKNSGTGLGLAIVSSIISAHNGSLEFANRADSTGAVFTLRLPVACK